MLRPATVALATGLAGLGVQAMLHLWLLGRRSPLVHRHRGTLTFVSALVGDGLVLPWINAALARQLEQWNAPLRSAVLRRAVLSGALLTAAAHVAQGWLRLVNWSMPRPFAWNPIGGYHALFMWAESAYLSYVAFVAAQRWRSGLADVPRSLIGALVGLVGFAVLVAYDYRHGTR